MFSLVPLRSCSAENRNLGDTVKQPFELISASERRELKKEVKASEEEPQGVAASWMALLCEKRDISEFFPKTVFILMEKLIYRVDGVKYVQWDRSEQRWHVDTVSNDISPLLQGHSVIHATEWIPKSWVSRRAVELPPLPM